MRWKSRAVAFTLCFALGFAVASIVSRLLSKQTHTTVSPCASANDFNSPEEILAALKSPEVRVRREQLYKLLLRPEISTVYYDYERDLNYPERADRAQLQYVQLDDSPEPEAVLTFVRFEHPIALVLKKRFCGWHLVGALSSWLRFEDYPYQDWLTLPQAIEPGIYQILIRDSYGDAGSYVRKARLLRLKNDVLTQIAEIEEESFEPVRGYDGPDWNDLKRHRINNYSFTSDMAFQGATIANEVTDEIVKLSGRAPQYSYWVESDGSWHEHESNWSYRPATRVKSLGISREILVWDAQQERYIK